MPKASLAGSQVASIRDALDWFACWRLFLLIKYHRCCGQPIRRRGQTTRHLGSIWARKSVSCLEDTKSVSGAFPVLLAGRVCSCQIAVLLRRSDIEASRLICLSCAKLGALHSHIHRTVVKQQCVVHKVQVITGLRSHALLDTFRPHCCVF